MANLTKKNREIKHMKFGGVVVNIDITQTANNKSMRNFK